MNLGILSSVSKRPSILQLAASSSAELSDDITGVFKKKTENILAKLNRTPPISVQGDISDFIGSYSESCAHTLVHLKTSIYDNLETDELKKLFLDQLIRHFHPLHNDQQGEPHFNYRLLRVFGGEINHFLSQDGDDEQALASSVGPAYLGPKGGSTLDQYAKSMANIQSISNLDGPSPYTERQIDDESTTINPVHLREQLIRLRELEGGDVESVKTQFKQLIKSLSDGDSVDLPLGLYGKDQSHAFGGRLVKAEDNRYWLILNDFGPRQTQRDVSDDKRYHSEIFCLDLTDANLDSFVDQITSMMVTPKTLNNHQNDFYEDMLPSVSIHPQPEKPLFVSVLEKDTHKEMTQPDCVRKTYNASVCGDFVEEAVKILERFDMPGIDLAKQKELAHSLSQFMYRLNKQSRDFSLYRSANQFQNDHAKYLLEQRMEMRVSKIEASYSDLVQKFNENGLDITTISEVERFLTLKDIGSASHQVRHLLGSIHSSPAAAAAAG